ncbi:MAG TPA: PPC domain-containing protein [Kofleriaceae bacterium]|nr:PPC domain-containing protein [Kofleriaceae bacterium]
MKLGALALACTPLLTLPLAACTEDDPYAGEIVKDTDGKADTSAAALFVDFEFDGQLVTDASWDAQNTIEDQLLYTIGQLNGRNAVGRLDKVQLTNVKTTPEAGRTKITYHARMPVSWGNKTNVPSTVALTLPRDMAYSGVDKFVTAYSHACVDTGAHDVDSGSMWYYFRPEKSGCSLASADVVKTTASVTVSPVNTTGKFPEYDKVWEDNSLNVVAIFGKYEDGATGADDAGIAGWNAFIAAVKTELHGYTVTTTPATIPVNPGASLTDIEFRATRPDGKQIKINALLTDNVLNALGGAAFKSRYEALSTRADFIVYNGHAGLGANVRALARAGRWVAGQYVIMFENGCDSYAYVDSAITDAHKAVNPDDATGTKYVDIVNNGMPAFFSSMPGATMALFRGLASYDAPKTYEQIFAGVDKSQVVMVTGEQDNAFVPGGGGQPAAWPGLDAHGTIKKGQTQKFPTPTLGAGTYTFTMTGTADADLYVRIGSEPTASSYDCRPYKNGSNEACEVTLPSAAKIYVQVRGYAATSDFELTGRKH